MTALLIGRPTAGLGRLPLRRYPVHSHFDILTVLIKIELSELGQPQPGRNIVHRR
jgi:hypothetical protein